MLLLGDSGTGKTYTAQKIVDLSSRKHEKFVRLNCSTIPETLAESELFGTEKGAFTGLEVLNCFFSFQQYTITRDTLIRL